MGHRVDGVGSSGRRPPRVRVRRSAVRRRSGFSLRRGGFIAIRGPRKEHAIAADLAVVLIEVVAAADPAQPVGRLAAIAGWIRDEAVITATASAPIDAASIRRDSSLCAPNEPQVTRLALHGYSSERWSTWCAERSARNFARNCSGSSLRLVGTRRLSRARRRLAHRRKRIQFRRPAWNQR